MSKFRDLVNKELKENGYKPLKEWTTYTPEEEQAIKDCMNEIDPLFADEGLTRDLHDEFVNNRKEYFEFGWEPNEPDVGSFGGLTAGEDEEKVANKIKEQLVEKFPELKEKESLVYSTILYMLKTFFKNEGTAFHKFWNKVFCDTISEEEQEQRDNQFYDY